jgi:hypothetical protein
MLMTISPEAHFEIMGWKWCRFPPTCVDGKHYHYANTHLRFCTISHYRCDMRLWAGNSDINLAARPGQPRTGAHRPAIAVWHWELGYLRDTNLGNNVFRSQKHTCIDYKIWQNLKYQDS